MLALIAERVSNVPFHDLVRHRVCTPAGLRDTEFFRSDELPDRTAVGYLPIDGVWRSNVTSWIRSCGSRRSPMPMELRERAGNRPQVDEAADIAEIA